MNLINKIYQEFHNFIAQEFNIKELPHFTFELNTNPENVFGDTSSNIAMLLAKELKKSPKDIANQIIEKFKNKFINKVELAGPGFLNFFLTNEAFTQLLKELEEFKEEFFKNNGKKFSYNIEFLSANPTGPIHLGNGRGGIIGDVLGNVLNFLGHKVTKEYYINDAGSQIQKLGNSFKIRCEQAIGMNSTLPEESYHGEYLVDLAQEYIKENGKSGLDKPEEFFAEYAKNKILGQIKDTLIEYGIFYDEWFSEKSLHESGLVIESIKELTKDGFTYESEGAVWFKSTEFGDDKDRVLLRANGEPTYVAADIAYMKSKIERGANFMIMILGHDHHSFAQRLKGLQKAINLDNYPFEIILYQLVRMKIGEKQLRMSKRSGSAITLEDVIKTVGKDVARFFYLNKKADAQLEFDLDLALKQSDENPVFYIQYAYVRSKSILEKTSQEGFKIDYKYAEYLQDDEKSLLKNISKLQDILNTIERSHQTHLLANYVIELATNFHSFYNKNRIIGLDDHNLAMARLLIVDQINRCLKFCFKLLGISAPEKM
ncbi:arginine--tRNA ligase [candidate division TM6 bacterium RIFCSPHIGHO2_12_FULL_32_22]|nr:MAG: arginine--tRNA ligase [candidate division TM6 bacterium RIFCSPHIGHO2_12_FULL_32_22]